MHGPGLLPASGTWPVSCKCIFVVGGLWSWSSDKVAVYSMPSVYIGFVTVNNKHFIAVFLFSFLMGLFFFDWDGTFVLISLESVEVNITYHVSSLICTYLKTRIICKGEMGKSKIIYIFVLL